MQLEKEQLPINSNNPKFSEEILESNKKQMLKILKQSPIAGVYRGEDQNHWPNFFRMYMDFLKSEIGPRGECSKAVRVELSKNAQHFDEVLGLLNLSHKSHIRDIYVKYKMYSPCKEYDYLIKMKDYLEKNEASYKCIMDENSIMYSKIKTGMIDKKGADYDYLAQIEAIRAKYRQKIAQAIKVIQQTQQYLNQNDNYVRYVKLKVAMQPYFAMWKQADMKVGFESIEKGDTFQKIVQEHLLPVILKRAGIDQKSKYKSEINCRWWPKNLGEIDIAIAIYNEVEQKWEVTVLIECKSRLYDIREAYKQVAILKQKGKQKLCTTLGILDLAPNPKFFIVTTLPMNPFNLPLQSKMKQHLEKAGKNKSIEELKEKQIFPVLKEIFKNQQSPLDWFLENDSDNIIVLNY